MKHKKLIVIVAVLITVTACAPYVDVANCMDGKTYGFWYGLLHGIIAPIELIAMLFSDKYTLFAANNNGFWYAFGFLLGSGGWGFLGGKSTKSKA